jgi:hypothetical protein
MIGCWFCHAVGGACVRCGSTEESRAADRAFYASFKPVEIGKPVRPKRQTAEQKRKATAELRGFNTGKKASKKRQP